VFEGSNYIIDVDLSEEFAGIVEFVGIEKFAVGVVVDTDTVDFDNIVD
jgi:hypothetical protein